MGAVVANFDPGGGRYKGVRVFYLGSETGGVVVWGGDVCTDPQDGSGPE